MTARRLLQTAHERGIILQAQAGRLRCAGPREALTPDLLAAIAEHRIELLSELEADFEELVRHRVEVFRDQATRPGGVPFLVLPGAPDAPGGCLSCGADLPAPGRPGAQRASKQRIGSWPCGRSLWITFLDLHNLCANRQNARRYGASRRRTDNERTLSPGHPTQTAGRPQRRRPHEGCH